MNRSEMKITPFVAIEELQGNNTNIALTNDEVEQIIEKFGKENVFVVHEHDNSKHIAIKFPNTEGMMRVHFRDFYNDKQYLCYPIRQEEPLFELNGNEDLGINKVRKFSVNGIKKFYDRYAEIDELIVRLNKEYVALHKAKSSELSKKGFIKTYHDSFRNRERYVKFNNFSKETISINLRINVENETEFNVYESHNINSYDIVKSDTFLLAVEKGKVDIVKLVEENNDLATDIIYPLGQYIKEHMSFDVTLSNGVRYQLKDHKLFEGDKTYSFNIYSDPKRRDAKVMLELKKVIINTIKTQQ